ncbi:MAG: TetR/AcrR family transcriptional regulator [Candidatus Marinimicrobia bacterium]|nr:TetR/AcrR family transcriptional regulator [Candidatus Neomarinimicrobiota bacterium]
MNEHSKKDTILESGIDIVNQLGPRFFTVEYLAQKLGMSKKTIYKFFPTKDNIIHSIFDYMMKTVGKKFSNVVNSTDNALVKFYKIKKELQSIDSRLSIEKIAEVKDRYPDLWKKLEQFRLERKNDFHKIIQEGQDQGLFSKDRDAEKLSGIIILFINQTLQPEILMKYNLTFYDMFDVFFDLTIKGLLSTKGRQELEKMENI